ncbi:MAG: dockerin type I domain-containing protein [Planctomycetota bacterium]|jgi:hypothetical protein
MDTPPDETNGLPDALQRELEALAGAAPTVPPARDAVMRDVIHDHFERPAGEVPSPRWNWRYVAGVAAFGAVAAVIGLSLTVVPVLQRPRSVDTAAPVVLAGDVDGSGRVDMLDAFAIARSVAASEFLAAHDVNGDGVIDDRDVQHVARLAVDLGDLGAEETTG